MTTPSPNWMTVLVIDDDHDNADTTALMISMWGYRVIKAYDGAAGILLARSERPDVILIDIAMPVVSGYMVMKELRDDPRLAKTFLIALTGFGGEPFSRNTLKLGFDLHCLKPVDATYLRQVLEEQHRRLDAATAASWSAS